MVNFLSKFLSHKPDEQEARITTENRESEAVAETLSASEPVSAPRTQAVGPDTSLQPERPMHYVDPHSGMPMHHGIPESGELEGFEATAGEALLPGTQIADEDAVVEALRTVYDPEIPVNIYDLGLIYTVDIAQTGDVNIEMSLTAPGCPVAGEMPGMVSDAVVQVEGVGVCTTKLVWEPAWSMDRMSDDAKLALGMF